MGGEITDNDLRVPESNRAFSRTGRPNRFGQLLVQVLQAARKKTGYFVGVVRDPETREVIREIELWRPRLGECVEFTIEWQPEPDDRR